MPEPVTISAFVLGAAAGLGVEFGGSQLVEPVCARLKAAFRARIAGVDGSLPRNHDVERAVRTAQLQACRAIIAEFGQEADRANRTSDIAFARQSSRWVERRIGLVARLRIDEADMTNLIAAIDVPLTSGSRPESDTLIAGAVEAAYQELAYAVPNPPDRFRRAFFDGEAGWFVAFGAFLAEQLKTDERFRTVFTGARLAELGGVLARIDIRLDSWISAQEPIWTEFRALADEVVVRLRGMEVKIDEALVLLKTLATSKDASEAEIAALQLEVRRLAADGALKTGAVESFLQDLGETPLSPDKWGGQLATFAERYRALRAEVGTRTNLPSEMERQRVSAEAAIEAGDLDLAESILATLSDRMARWREEQRQAHQQSRREEAAIRARRAEIARTRMRYGEAAALFAEAAVLEPADDPELIWQLRMKQAAALYDQSYDLGDNAAGQEAISAYRLALDATSRDRAPLQWANTQNNLGNALKILGEREIGPARLEQSVEAFKAALLEYSRERAPLDWAMIQNNLGNALLRLGERESGVVRLKEASEAYRAALSERTRERVPIEWAVTQNNLAIVLQTLGERETGTARLEEAIEAYRAALLELTRERTPQDWAMTQNNLGTALQFFGARANRIGPLREAVEAYRAALLERARERVPLQWATTQNNIGNALQTLSAHESGTERLYEAVEAYRAALLERARDRVPLDWAETNFNLANAKLSLFSRTGERAHLEEAQTSAREALAFFELGRPSHYIDQARRLVQQLQDIRSRLI